MVWYKTPRFGEIDGSKTLLIEKMKEVCPPSVQEGLPLERGRQEIWDYQGLLSQNMPVTGRDT